MNIAIYPSGSNEPLSPTGSEIFHSIKSYFDNYFYGESRKVTGFPNFKEFVIKGNGAIGGETIKVYNGDISIGTIQSNSDGNFSLLFEPNYEDVNIIKAEGSTSGVANVISFDAYYFLNLIFALSNEYVRAIQMLAQDKQNIYIDSTVGDNVREEPLLITQKDRYTNPPPILIEHMPIKFPSENWQGTLEDLTKGSIKISDQGLVLSSIELFDKVFEGAGCSGVFFYPYENFRWLNLESGSIPTVSQGILYDTIHIPSSKLRIKRIIERVKETSIDMTDNEKDKYVWFYVDGERNADGTLVIHESTIQPLPEKVSIAKTYETNEVLTDEDGEKTGIEYQKYVILDPPAYALASSFTITEGGESINYAKLITRDILALGKGTIKSSITVEYPYYKEPILICVLKVDDNNKITGIYRIFSQPDHIESSTLFERANAELYFKFDSFPNATIRKTIREFLDNFNPLNRPLLVFASSGSEQDIIDEDSLSWSGIWKGFRYIGAGAE